MENIKIIKLENGDDIVCSFPMNSYRVTRIIKDYKTFTNKIYSTINT